MIATIINALIGIWLMAAPSALNYEGTAANTIDRIIGPIIGTLAIIAINEVTRPVRWAVLPFGLWLLVAPWLFNYPTAAIVNDMICGAAIAALCLVRGKITARFGGGWAQLWSRNPPHTIPNAD